MNMETFYDPACGSSKALAEGGVVGEGGSGKTALLLNYLSEVIRYKPAKNIFLCSHHADLKEHTSELYEAIQQHDFVFDLSMFSLQSWEDFSGWKRYTRRYPQFKTPKTSSYGQSFLAYPTNEYPTCSVELLDQCRNKGFDFFESSPLPCMAESRTESSFPGQGLSIYLFLRQVYRLAAFLLARLAAFFQTPVVSVKKAVSERRFFVLNETHPPDTAALSGGLLTAF